MIIHKLFKVEYIFGNMKEVKRPWGSFKQFSLNKKSTVKIISIKPYEELSLQKHKHRREMWYFLTPGKIQIGEKKFNVKKEEIVNIPINVSHRIFAGKNNVDFLEISFGKFDEKDEIRMEDKYGRKSPK